MKSGICLSVFVHTHTHAHTHAHTHTHTHTHMHTHAHTHTHTVKSEDTKSPQVPKEAKTEPVSRKLGRAQRNTKSENVQGRVVLPTAEAQAVYEIYGPIDAGTKKEKPVTPIV